MLFVLDNNNKGITEFKAFVLCEFRVFVLGVFYDGTYFMMAHIVLQAMDIHYL